MSLNLPDRRARIDDDPGHPPSRASATSRALHHWPSVLGIVTCALISLDLAEGVELAKVLAGSATVYLGAASIGSRRAAWPVFGAAVLVILGVDAVAPAFEATWAVLALSAILALYGLARWLSTADRGQLGSVLQAQGTAMVIFGTGAVVATVVSRDLGSLLVAAGLLGHAAWDVYHYRARTVVALSLAEFCMVLDTSLAFVITALVVA